MTKQQSSKIYLIGDPGSCHCGDMKIARELVRVGRECGLDAVKFQLFPDEEKYTKSGNIPLNHGDFKKLVRYGRLIGIEVFASVFDRAAYNTVAKNCTAVKFSYNSPMMGYVKSAVSIFGADKVFVSGDVMNKPPKKVKSLYCISEYPVKHKVDFFYGIFKMFNGFSDHTMGITQSIEAARAGAKIIEKHFRLNDSKCDSVPDGRFAIRPKDIEYLCAAVK